MKCHWCKKELETIHDYDEPNQNNAINEYECPNGHARICMSKDGKEITQYKLVWDADEHAQERYELKYSYGKTDLLKKAVAKKYWRYRSSSPIFSTESMIPIVVDGDIMDIGVLIARLKKLKAFS